MKLFIELYLDEDVSVLLAELLRARGYDVTTALEAGMLTKDDPEQLTYAVSKGCCILTHNREHFEKLHNHYIKNSLHHYGIIIATRRPIYKLMNRVLAILNKLTADEIEDNLIYI